MTTKTIHMTEATADAPSMPTGIITFTFDDKSTESFDLSKVNDATKLRLAMHGASQKIGDSYAGANAADNPVEYAKTAVRETIKDLYAGSWRAASGGGPRVSDLAVAFSRASGKPLDACVAFVNGLDDDNKKALRNKAKVKIELAKITAEKAAARLKKLSDAASATPEGDADALPDVPDAPAEAAETEATA